MRGGRGRGLRGRRSAGRTLLPSRKDVAEIETWSSAGVSKILGAKSATFPRPDTSWYGSVSVELWNFARIRGRITRSRRDPAILHLSGSRKDVAEIEACGSAAIPNIPGARSATFPRPDTLWCGSVSVGLRNFAPIRARIARSRRDLAIGDRSGAASTANFLFRDLRRWLAATG